VNSSEFFAAVYGTAVAYQKALTGDDNAGIDDERCSQT